MDQALRPALLSQIFLHMQKTTVKQCSHFSLYVHQVHTLPGIQLSEKSKLSMLIPLLLQISTVAAPVYCLYHPVIPISKEKCRKVKQTQE